MNWSTPLEMPAGAGQRHALPAAPDTGLAKKLSLTAAVLSLVVALIGGGTWAAFSDTTSSPGNTFSTGSISLTADREGTAMFTASGMLPGDPALVECIEVTYAGGLDADVALYGVTDAPGDLAPYLDVVVDKGTSCTGFTSTGNVYTGTLDGYPDDYATGIAEGTWTNSQTVAYQFTVSLQNDDAAQGKDVTQAFVWEARTP